MAEGNGRNFRQYCFRVTHMSHIHIGLSGRYTIEKRNAAGEVVQTLEFDNLITDAGLERWGTDGVIDRCYLGSGTTPPAVTDTAMAASLGVATSTTTAPGNTYSAAAATQTINLAWRAGPGVCTGDIREVGVGWSTGLWSRALIRDTQGNPTTISKAADETLDVSYAVTLQYPTTPIVGSITIQGVSYDWRAYPYLPTSGSTLSSIFSTRRTGAGSSSGFAYDGGNNPNGNPSGSAVGYTTSITSSPYVPGSKRVENTYQFGLDRPGTYRTFWVKFGNSYYTTEAQVEFTPGIPKDAAQTLKVVFSHSWGRA